jgi:hypothetical protein
VSPSTPLTSHEYPANDLEDNDLTGKERGALE